jgi:hypothetical protein
MLRVRRGPVKGEAWSRGGEVCSCLGGGGGKLCYREG